MRRLLGALAVACALWAHPAAAAIARDAASTGGVNFASSLTWSHTCTGVNLLLFVQLTIVTNSGGGDPTSGTIAATYNGVAMTEVAHSSQAPGAFAQATYLFALANPSTGANTVSISTTGPSTFAVIGSAASYTGTAGTVDVSTTNSTTGTSLTTSLTPTSANGWTLLAVKVAGTDPAAGTGASQNGSLAGNHGLFDSNGTVANGSAYSMQITTSASNRLDVVMAAFGPAGGAPAGSFRCNNALTLLGVGCGGD